MREERGVAAGRLAVWVGVVVLASVAGLGRLAAGAPPVAVERWTMPNGLVVLLVERHTIPAVEAHLVIKTGAVADPSGREGLAALTAELLAKGTATRSAVEIAEAIDFIGGSLTAQAGDDFSTLSLTTLDRKSVV